MTADTSHSLEDDDTLRGRMRAFERAAISDALAQCEGNGPRAAGLLGMPLRTLQHKIREHGLKR